jgi:hypothetical protein
VEHIGISPALKLVPVPISIKGIVSVPAHCGHKDWKMLRRYTHLKPEARCPSGLVGVGEDAVALHAIANRKAAA